MKKIVSLGIALLSMLCVHVWAADSGDVTQLIVRLVGGGQHSFSLPDKPVITFEGSNMKVSSTAAEMEFLRSNVVKMDFEKSTAAIGVLGQDCDFSFSYVDNNTVIVSGKQVTSAAVYGISGVKMAERTAVDNSVTIDVSELAAGVYVVAIPGYNSVKIIKK